MVLPQNINVINTSIDEIIEKVRALKQKNTTTKELLTVLGKINNHQLYRGHPIIVKEISDLLLCSKGKESASKFLGKMSHVISEYSDEYLNIANQLGVEVDQSVGIDSIGYNGPQFDEIYVGPQEKFFTHKYLDQFKYMVSKNGIEDAISCLAHEELPEGIVTNINLYLLLYYAQSRNKHERLILKTYLEQLCSGFESIKKVSDIIIHVIKGHNQILQGLIQERIKKIIHLPNQLQELESLCVKIRICNVDEDVVLQYYDIYCKNGGTHDIDHLQDRAYDKKFGFQLYGPAKRQEEIIKALADIPMFVSSSSIDDVYFVFFALINRVDFVSEKEERIKIAKEILDNIPINHKETPEYAQMYYTYYCQFDRYSEENMLKSIRLLYMYNSKLFHKLYNSVLLPWMRSFTKHNSNTSLSYLYRLNSNVFNDIANGIRVPVNTMADVISKFNSYI